MGLRERKKAQTRQRITETAARLFGERGFDAVTAAEVAWEAEVAEATLFNYFPTKEELFYSGLETFGARLVESVRDRPAGQPVVSAFRSFVLGESGQLDQLGRLGAGEPEALDRARTTARVVMASPALQARERRILLGIAADLATAFAPTTAADPVVPLAVAHALMGVHMALLDHSRDRLLHDERPETIAVDLRTRATQVLALLERGLHDFAPAPPRS